MFSKVSPRHAF